MALIVAVLAVLHWPQILINSRTLRLGALLAERAGYRISWHEARAGVRSRALLIKELELHFDHLCIQDLKNNELSVCFAHADLSVEGSLTGLRPRILAVGPIFLTGGDVRLNLDRLARGGGSEARPSRRSSDQLGFAPAWLRESHIGPIRIDVPRWDVTSHGHAIAGSFHLANFARRGAEIHLEADARGDLPIGGIRGDSRVGLRLIFQNSRGLWSWNHWIISGGARGMLANGARIELRTRVHPRLLHGTRGESGEESNSVALDYGIDARARQGSRDVRARLAGSLTEDHFFSNISATAKGLTPQLSDVRLHDCGLSLNRWRDGATGSRIGVDCQVGFQLPALPESFSALEVPTRSGVRIKADLASSDSIPSIHSILKGEVAVILRPVTTSTFHGGGEVVAELNGPPSEFSTGQGWGGVTVDLHGDVPDFQKLVSRLSFTPWAIPAPVRVLQGDVRLNVAGTVDPNGGVFPLRLVTRLASGDQDLSLEGRSTVQVDYRRGKPLKVQLNGEVLLTDVRIELPRLANPGKANFELPPRLLPDDRIISASRARKERAIEVREKAVRPAIDFDYDLKIRTPPGHPVRIITNLAKGPVPINLDLKLVKGRPVTGDFRVASFPVEFFKRKATVESLDLKLQNPVDASPVTGEVRVPVSDFIVLIQIVGTAGAPHVVLNSEPPLPQSQLLSLLLYGVPPSALEPDQGQTVGSAQAALSAGALNLASLYFLASTPIQSVSYDPTTGSVVASITLGGGASLNVGAGSAQTGETVGISKRLGKNFYITSDVGYVTATQQTQMSALLEWAHRY